MALHVLEANLCDNGQNAVGLVTGEHDLYVFPEACHGGERLDALQQRADELGFRFIQTPYGDHDGRRDTHEFVVLARADLMAENAEVVRMGATNQERAAGIGRAAIRLAMQDPANGVSVDIFAVHLDDRRERTRLGQMKTLLNYAKEDCATAIIGGFELRAICGRGGKGKKSHFSGNSRCCALCAKCAAW